MYEKGRYRPAPPWGWGLAIKPTPRYVWNETGVADVGHEQPQPAPLPEPQPEPEPALDPDGGQAVAALMRHAKLRWQAERLAELADFLEREKRWQELRNSVNAYRMKFGCGMPTAEHLEVFRQLYPSRSGTACNGTDLMALGRGSRLDPGYLIPNKIS
jgi:hypothetical protein